MTMTSVHCQTEPKRGSTLIWLAYLAFVFIEPILIHHHKIALWIATLTSITLFLSVFTVYVRSESLMTRRWMILLTFSIGLATLPWNNGATTYFIYVAAFIPYQFPSVRSTLQLFAIEIGSIAAEWYLFRNAGPLFRIPWESALFGAFLLLVIGGSNIYFAEQKRADAKLRAAQKENVALAALAERERIARDLHDVLGHTLSVIVLKAELAGRLLASEPDSETSPARARAVAEINDVERITRSALAEVRETIGGYRAHGLRAEIEAARKTLDAAGVTLILANDGSSVNASLSPNEETVFSLALREAVTNIVRHARATTCTLHFHSAGNSTAGQHRLTIEDNGSALTTPREGNGLRGMRERVEALGGQISVNCAPGVRLQIALPRQQQSKLTLA